MYRTTRGNNESLNWEPPPTTLYDGFKSVRLFLCRSVILMSLLAVCADPAHTQDQSPPRAKTCVVYTIQDLSAGTDTGDYALPITASVRAAIEVSGFSMVPADALEAEIQKGNVSPRALLGDTASLAVARVLKADLAVSGYYVVQDEQIFISLQCWDVQAGRLATGLQEDARFNLAFYSFLHEHVTEMLPHVQLRQETEAQGAAATASTRATALTRITFLSPDEGMEIRIAGDLSIGTISDGRLTWRPDGLSQGTRLVVEKRKPGYHTSWQTVRALGEIKLSRLEKEHTLSVEADWTWGQLAGLGSAFRVLPEARQLLPVRQRLSLRSASAERGRLPPLSRGFQHGCGDIPVFSA